MSAFARAKKGRAALAVYLGSVTATPIRRTDPNKLPAPRTRRIWTDLARILSTIFNPFLTSLALFVILAHEKAQTTPDFWVLLFNSVFFTSIGPMLFVFWLYSRGIISDLDMSIRAERQRVFGVFVAFLVAGVGDLWLIHAPVMLIATMAGYTASSVVVMYITHYWKISTHALGITAPLVALLYLFGWQPLPFLILIPIICWARVYLRAHTLGQVVAGTGLGAVTVVLFFRIFGVL